MPFLVFLLFLINTDATSISTLNNLGYNDSFFNSLSSEQLNDLETMGLKGTVKNIREISSHKDKIITSLYEFNENGKLILEESYIDSILDGKVLRTYNENGQLIEKTIYHNGFPLSTTSYEYNKKGLLIKELESEEEDYTLFKYNSKGLLIEELVYSFEELLLKITYDYDKQNQLREVVEYDVEEKASVLEKIEYNEFGKKVSVSEYEGKELLLTQYFVYNESQQLIEKGLKYEDIGIQKKWLTIYDENGNIINVQWTNRKMELRNQRNFEYDEQGNWIKLVNNNKSITTRTINYY